MNHLSRQRCEKARISEPCRHLEDKKPCKRKSEYSSTHFLLPCSRKSARFVWEHVLHLERLSCKTSKMSLLFSSLINEELTHGVAFFTWKILFLCVCGGGRLIAKSWLTFFMTLRVIAHQVPLSMGFPKQEYWNGLPLLSPGDFPNPGSKLCFLLGRQILYHWATWEELIPFYF